MTLCYALLVFGFPSVLALVGCGGAATDSPLTSGGVGGRGLGGFGSGAAPQTTSGGVATSGGAAMGPGGSAGTLTGAGTGGGSSVDLTRLRLPRCGPLDPDRADACNNLELIVPLGPDVSSFVDGSIQVGELSRVFSWVANNDSVAHDDVCLGVAVNVPGITLYNDPGETNPLLLKNLYPGATPIVTPAGKIVGDVAPGTIATFTFWTTYFGTSCIGPTVAVDAEVKAYPFP
jgi:hypothetical protein